jgi:DNA repair protein RecO (recombination protein O)
VTLYRDTGVVLRTYKLGEADRIVVILTAEHGKVRAVAKGIRKTKSRFGGRLEPLSHLSLLMYEHRQQNVTGRELDIVSQAETIDSPGALLGDLDRLTQGLALVEAVDQITLDRDPAPSIYKMLVGALRTLETKPSPVVVPAFYWKLLAIEGVRPQLDVCVSCGLAEPEVTLVSFDMNEGGALCRSCRRGRPVSADALRITRMILGGQLALALDEAPSPATAEVGHLATAALEHHLVRKLKSVAVFEKG